MLVFETTILSFQVLEKDLLLLSIWTCNGAAEELKETTDANRLPDEWDLLDVSSWAIPDGRKEVEKTEHVRQVDYARKIALLMNFSGMQPVVDGLARGH